MRTSERGAVLIHVAVAIFVLIGFTSFVVDQGIAFLGRNQMQNAADAAALAGAMARAFDEPGDDDPLEDGITTHSINTTVDLNMTFGATPGSSTGRTWSWDCPPEYVGLGWCVKVNTYRNGEEGSATLPMFFGPFFGVTEQGARASATAIAQNASGTTCMKPWLIPDRWEDLVPPTTAFNEGDNYAPPLYDDEGNATGGTGYRFPDDNGVMLTLKAGNPAQSISPSDFYEIETATDYEESITDCKITKSIGDTVTALPGNRVGPTNQGLDDLLAAHDGGPVDVVVGLFSPAEFAAQDRQSGTFELVITNMLTFRIYERNGNEIVGEIVAGPGDLTGGLVPSGGSSLLKVIRLIR
jgi:hypothetical protein